MRFGDAIRARCGQLERRSAEMAGKLEALAKNATIRAVETAAEKTPQNKLSGANTQSGELRQHWAADSRTAPERAGNRLTTELANSLEYASYVNNGHRMDRHFVPGLNIDGASGTLQFDPGKDVGIVVGTRTAYVPGIYMAEAAKETYERVAGEGLERLAREALR